jgi:hypothetical protein
MVTNVSLTNFSNERNQLLIALSKKIAATKVTALNEVFDNKYKVEKSKIELLLKAIEAKFKKCEILYYSYLRDVDHSIVAGMSSGLPFETEIILTDGTAILNYSFKVNDKDFYKEIIDQNFQVFILTLASLYENLVLLMEIFMKKVMIYVRRPTSSPLHDYLEYLDRLINLGYRQTDKFSACLNTSSPFFKKYLIQINKLRNSFIHGYSLCLQSDGYTYFVENIDTASFSVNSPDLQLDKFSTDLIEHTRKFVRSLFETLRDSISHYKKQVPA